MAESLIDERAFDAWFGQLVTRRNPASLFRQVLESYLRDARPHDAQPPQSDVERVAKAMLATFNQKMGTKITDWEAYLPLAKAAIDAVKEPTL